MNNKRFLQKKWMLIAVIFLSSSIYTLAQGLETSIKIQAMDMAKAILAKDVNKIIQYMPPSLVEQSGGKDKLMIARDTVNKYMKQFGAEIKKVTIGNPGKIINYKKQLQSLVPQTTEIKFMASIITLETTLIAISEDKGQHWYFVDTSIYHTDKLEIHYPT